MLTARKFVGRLFKSSSVEQLDVSIDGLGPVEYMGDPTVTQTINGLGTVRQR